LKTPPLAGVRRMPLENQVSRLSGQGASSSFTEYGTDTTFRKQELFNPPKNIGDDLRSEMLHVRLDVSNTADLLILTTRTIRPDPSQN